MTNATTILQNMQTEAGAFAVPRGRAPLWADEAIHGAMYADSPELYALGSLLADEDYQKQVLFQLLKASRAGFTTDQRILLERVSALLMCRLPADTVLQVLLAVRRVRANHKHTTRAIMRYLLDHPALADLVSRRRATVLDLLEHALGRNVARACLRADRVGYARRHLMRFATEPARVAAVLPFLARRGVPPLAVRDYQMVHPRKVSAVPPGTVTATNRGEVSAALVQVYRGGPTPTLMAALSAAVEAAAARLPRFDGRVGLVLDTSASMRGYGDRELCAISQSVALWLVLQRVVPRLHTVRVGTGAGFPPAAAGATDLAGGLLTAAQGQPDLLICITDGYENSDQGDLAAVIDALPGAGLCTPVVLCISQFTGRDDLALRDPAPGVPKLGFWHQDQFRALAMKLFARAPEPLATHFLRGALHQELQLQVEEVKPWLSC